MITGVFLSILLFRGGHAQEETPADWKAFKARAAGYYQVLSKDSINNFSCFISADFYIDFIKSIADSNYYYPLKYIWTRSADQYFVLQPLPENLSDSLRREVLVRVQELKNLFNGIMLDWYRYSIRTPLDDVPDSARVKFARDTVGVFYQFQEENQKVEVQETYSRAGQLGRVIWRNGAQKVVTYPLFDEVENKWLCIGWDSQRYQNDAIISGVAVRLELVKKNGQFLPVQFNIIVQTQENPEQQILTSIYIKNFIFNENFQVLSSPGESVPPKPTPPGQIPAFVTPDSAGKTPPQ